MDHLKTQQSILNRYMYGFDFVGRDDWIRTSDLCVPNAALYQAEPRPDPGQLVAKKNPPVQCFQALCIPSSVKPLVIRQRKLAVLPGPLWPSDQWPYGRLWH